MNADKDLIHTIDLAVIKSIWGYIVLMQNYINKEMSMNK